MNRWIQWFVENRVAANLLMVLIFIGAVFSSGRLDKEVFPTVSLDFIDVSMSYPGAGPTEVEEQVVIRIEEAIADIDGIEQITSTANQGRGQVSAEVVEGYDPQRVLNDIKTQVDAINTFPSNVERPVVSERVGRSFLMNAALYGDVSEAALKETGWRVRNELSLLEEVSQVKLNGTRPYEMGIEVSEARMRRYGLSFEDISRAISESSLNIPAGVIRSHSGDIQIQTRNQAYTAEDFRRIPVITGADGTRVLLRDVAEVRDGFDDWSVFAQFNGKPAVFLELTITGDPDVVAASDQVKDYIERNRDLLPAGLELEAWQDMSRLYESRLNLLLKNAITGLILVFVVLMLFLRPLLAAWVCVGIATAFAGAVWWLPYTGVSLNMISLFAFLLVLGIVVDDAIIVGESIYTRHQQGLKGAASAASGAKLVAVPVFLAVISTIVFFAPMMAVPGSMGTVTFAIPVVVILCLVFSLIECLLILPTHLSHLKPETESRFAPLRRLTRARQWVAKSLDRFADRVYLPGLQRMLRHKVATLTGFAVAFFVALAVLVGGWLVVSFMPMVPSDYLQARVTLPEGTPFHETRRIMKQVESAAQQLESDEQLTGGEEAEFIDGIQTWAWENNIHIVVGLADAGEREVSSPEVSQRWRELIGPIPEAKEYRLEFTINAAGDDINLNLSIADNDLEAQKAAARAVSEALARFPDVYNVENTIEEARREISLRLKPRAHSLGVSLAQVAEQVRQGFYGAEVQRIPRGIEDVRVLVRYPREARRHVSQLDRMRIRLPDGSEIPLQEVAEIDYVPGYTSIERRDRKRSIGISASVEEGGDANAIVGELLRGNLTDWQRDYPGLTLTPDGNMQDQADFMDSMSRNFLLAVLIIYAIMAVNFRSYWQPVVILTAIPFGFVGGTVVGHLIMGLEISMMSMLGFFACAGVVVNDNLVLLDRINRLRHQGHSAMEAVIQGGRDRFRAIVLTSVTTFIGLMPIMAEQSVQAQFLIPMVISLAFGVLFATTVTLILVPTLYLTAHRLGERWRAWRGREPADEQRAESGVSDESGG